MIVNAIFNTNFNGRKNQTNDFLDEKIDFHHKPYPKPKSQPLYINAQKINLIRRF